MRIETPTLDRIREVLRAREARRDDPPEARPAAVSLSLVEGPAGLEALFIVRATIEGDPWSGQVALPGGRIEPADPDLRATAIRETREEIGVDLSGAEMLGPLDDVYPRSPVLPPLFVRPFVFALAGKPSLSLSDEVADALWVPLATLSDPANRDELELVVRGERRRFPAWRLGGGAEGQLLWGMTERIMTQFLELLTC